jgi:sigma-B regulation protein RsbU (phosphoserine phosphatase)
MIRTNTIRTDYETLTQENNRLHAALAAEYAELQRFHSDLEVARSMQQRIFPTARPRIPGLDYFGDWRPAQRVSGDYIDYFEMSNGDLGFAIGDVCGKGLPAALLTSSLHSMIRALRVARHSGLKEQVRTIDKLFAEICPDNCYASLFLGEYDPSTGHLRYVNAGHEPPFVLRQNGDHPQAIFLESGGPVIGMLRQTTYREGMITLAPGDLLVAYTDGLCDTVNRAGEDWGWPRFLDTVVECGKQRARDLVETVLQAAEDFAAGAPQPDDVTLWVARVDDAMVREAEPVAA